MIIQTKGDVVKLRGSLVENQWPAIRSAVRLLLDEHPSGVIVDASELTDISESGAHTFLDASNFIQSHSARVIICGLSPKILEQIRKIPGVRSQLVIASNVEEARASLESGGVVGVQPARTKPAILVPMVGAWSHALEFAAAEAHTRRAEVHLVFVLEVPRNLAIGAPMPEQEQDAQRSLSEAEKSLKRRGLTVRKSTTRARDIIEGAAKFAAEAKPVIVVVAYLKSELEKQGGQYSMLGTLCHESPCDVAILCVKD